MNYVDKHAELAFTAVEDKYGIIPLANDLLLAMHYAEISSTNFDDETARKNDVTNNMAVADTSSQFLLSVISLFQDLGQPITVNDLNTSSSDYDNRTKEIEQLDTDFKALFSNVDAYTREELTTASDTFGVKVNEFIQMYGDDYRDELTELTDRLVMLETAIDNPNKLGVVRIDSIKRPATLDDYVELVQEQIYNLYI